MNGSKKVMYIDIINSLIDRMDDVEDFRLEYDDGEIKDQEENGKYDLIINAGNEFWDISSLYLFYASINDEQFIKEMAYIIMTLYKEGY